MNNKYNYLALLSLIMAIPICIFAAFHFYWFNNPMQRPGWSDSTLAFSLYIAFLSLLLSIVSMIKIKAGKYKTVAITALCLAGLSLLFPLISFFLFATALMLK